jgi:hypothetical protein
MEFCWNFMDFIGVSLDSSGLQWTPKTPRNSMEQLAGNSTGVLEVQWSSVEWVGQCKVLLGIREKIEGVSEDSLVTTLEASLWSRYRVGAD